MNPIIEAGRVCVVIKGSDAGKEVVIQEIVDKNFVIIEGEKVKRRKSNVAHLEPTARKSTAAFAKKERAAKEKRPQGEAAAEKKEAPKKKGILGRIRKKEEAKP
jgi:ribosomal protein L14E/L6E/L27E